MKKMLSIFIWGTVAAFIYSCTKDNSNPAFTKSIQEGSWKITEFWHIDHFETVNYKNYKVTFTEQDVVSASGINFYTGHWHLKNDHLTMDFQKATFFERFNAEWHILEHSDQTIKLELTNDNAEAPDRLVFEKI